jgi:Fe-S cluster assembly protein SufD
MKNDFEINERFAEIYRDYVRQNSIEPNETALALLAKTKFPTLKDEEWRFTNVAPILKKNFEPTTKEDKARGDLREKINRARLLDSGALLVFENGFLNEELSDLSELPEGAVVGGLANAKKENPELVGKFLGKAIKNKNAFEILNGLFATDGAFVYIPKNTAVEKPISVVFVNGAEGNPKMISPRNIIALEENAEAKVIFSYNGEGEEYFLNYATEVFAGENASLQLYEFKNESDAAFHIGSTESSLAENANYNHYEFDLSGKLVRNNLTADLDGENIECHFYGFYVAKENRHADNHTYINHNKPNCFSNEIYKGILDDEAKAVFSGKILVAKDAQKTNAYQSNKTILLSDTARIDTKPQLEIYADDVKCTHGATVGQLDSEMLFYIVSRGIPEDTARTLLIKAFAADVIEGVKLEELKDAINEKILKAIDE